MRKVLFVVLLLVGAVTAAYSQVTMSFGPKLGLAIANESYNPDLQSSIDKSSRTGFTGGAAFEMMFSGIPLGIEADLFYTMGGTVLEGPVFANELGGPVTGTLTEKLTFIEIPVLLKGKFPTGTPVSPYVYAGPSLGFLAAAKDLQEPTGYLSDEVDGSSDYTSTDFSLVFGAGADFKIESKVAVTFDIRYGLGLTDMVKNPLPDQSTLKTNGLSFLIGCMFQL